MQPYIQLLFMLVLVTGCVPRSNSIAMMSSQDSLVDSIYHVEGNDSVVIILNDRLKLKYMVDQLDSSLSVLRFQLADVKSRGLLLGIDNWSELRSDSEIMYYSLPDQNLEESTLLTDLPFGKNVSFSFTVMSHLSRAKVAFFCKEITKGQRREIIGSTNDEIEHVWLPPDSILSSPITVITLSDENFKAARRKVTISVFTAEPN